MLPKPRNLVSSPIISRKLFSPRLNHVLAVTSSMELFCHHFFGPCWDLLPSCPTYFLSHCLLTTFCWPCPQNSVFSPLHTVPFLALKAKFQADTSVGKLHSHLQLTRLRLGRGLSCPTNNHGSSSCSLYFKDDKWRLGEVIFSKVTK